MVSVCAAFPHAVKRASHRGASDPRAGKEEQEREGLIPPSVVQLSFTRTCHLQVTYLPNRVTSWWSTHWRNVVFIQIVLVAMSQNIFLNINICWSETNFHQNSAWEAKNNNILIVRLLQGHWVCIDSSAAYNSGVT